MNASSKLSMLRFGNKYFWKEKVSYILSHNPKNLYGNQPKLRNSLSLCLVAVLINAIASVTFKL